MITDALITDGELARAAGATSLADVVPVMRLRDVAEFAITRYIASGGSAIQERIAEALAKIASPPVVVHRNHSGEVVAVTERLPNGDDKRLTITAIHIQP